MRGSFTVFRREIAGLFLSPLAWILLFVSLLANGFFFFTYLSQTGNDVTASLEGDAGRIGLFAVSEAQRGRGVASRLLEAIGRWMRHGGAKRARVATQRDNRAACRCYERAGYAVEERLALHHLWRVRDER